MSTTIADDDAVQATEANPDTDAGSPESKAAVVHDTEDTTAGHVYVPSAYPAAALAGSLLGLLLLGLAAVGIRDYIVRFGWISGQPWTETVADSIATSTWQTWMWPVVVALIIVGIWCVWLAVKPRRRTHVPLADYEVMWTRRGDVARRTSAAMLAVPGVEHATTVVGRRKAKVTVTTDTEVDEATLRAQATEAVSALQKPPTIAIKNVSRTTKGTRS